jgi:NAD(P)-dependent dehydrogenase (short-subunit alcohol dehydrogenase family)
METGISTLSLGTNSGGTAMTSKRKVAIITGASGGIGAALAKRFRDLDYGVVATSRSIMKTGSISDDATLTIEGDIGEPGTAVRVVDAAVERFGRIDLLINNAGIFIPKPFVDYSLHDFTSMSGVNLRGFFHISQQAASRMLQAGFGHIVNITAAIADQPLAALPAALAALTKGGLAAATRSLAIEYATRGIRVNAVAPGVVNTSLLPPEMRGMLTAMQPLGRMGETHDVVDAVVYLEQAPFVTGEILRVDGAAFSGGGAW